METLLAIFTNSEVINHIIRLFTISFGTLGFIYILTRQFGIKIKTSTQHVLSVLVMFVFSLAITFIYYYEGFVKALWESFIFSLLANVIYIIICRSLFIRMDKFLDKKIGKD